MPSGSKPKIYDPELIEDVRRLYLAGATQYETANALGITQKVVWNLMRRAGIAARVAAKRDQRGPKNHAWKGGAAKYAALHLRVQAERGAPNRCEDCGTTEAPRFEWASISGNYTDVNDYKRLCCSCHHKMDGHAKNLGNYAKKKQEVPR